MTPSAEVAFLQKKNDSPSFHHSNHSSDQCRNLHIIQNIAHAIRPQFRHTHHQVRARIYIRTAGIPVQKRERRLGSALALDEDASSTGTIIGSGKGLPPAATFPLYTSSHLPCASERSPCSVNPSPFASTLPTDAAILPLYSMTCSPYASEALPYTANGSTYSIIHQASGEKSHRVSTKIWHRSK